MKEIFMNTIEIQGPSPKGIYAFAGTDDRHLDFGRILPFPEGCRDKLDWASRNWGTRWNAFQVRRLQSVYFFKTFGGVPSPVMAALARKFPQNRFTHRWSRVHCFIDGGIAVYANGIEVMRSATENVEEVPWFGDERWDSLGQTSSFIVAE